MYTEMGACIILLGMRSGLKRNMQFVGTIATAYYLALICFLLIPASGPFFIRHGNEGGVSSGVYQMQSAVIAQLNMIKTGQRFSQIGLDYYIALPCMHIVQPLIALWFFRRWKILAVALAAYDALLVAAILLLDQHYVIDLIGGVAVSALAIVMVDRVGTNGE